jgi:hypothetical protein
MGGRRREEAGGRPRGVRGVQHRRDWAVPLDRGGGVVGADDERDRVEVDQAAPDRVSRVCVVHQDEHR